MEVLKKKINSPCRKIWRALSARGFTERNTPRNPACPQPEAGELVKWKIIPRGRFVIRVVNWRTKTINSKRKFTRGVVPVKKHTEERKSKKIKSSTSRTDRTARGFSGRLKAWKDAVAVCPPWSAPGPLAAPRVSRYPSTRQSPARATTRFLNSPRPTSLELPTWPDRREAQVDYWSWRTTRSPARLLPSHHYHPRHRTAPGGTPTSPFSIKGRRKLPFGKGRVDKSVNFVIFQDISKYFRIFEDASGYFRYFKLWKGTLEYLRHFRIFQITLGFLKLLQDIWKYLWMFCNFGALWNTSSHFKVFQGILDTSRYFKKLQNI